MSLFWFNLLDMIWDGFRVWERNRERAHEMNWVITIEFKDGSVPEVFGYSFESIAASAFERLASTLPRRIIMWERNDDTSRLHEFARLENV